MNVLITGGAGFIGTHLTRRLLREGCTITILDNFSRQVHGDTNTLPQDIAPHVRLIVGDVRHKLAWKQALKNQDVVVHLAAETGTGQSMYKISHYEKVNIGSTALLFDLITNDIKSSINKVVVASSRAIYGEGKYSCPQHSAVFPSGRSEDNLRKGSFDPVCPICHEPCQATATDEDSLLSPISFYGLTKKVQEEMTLLFTRAQSISGFALRYQNVYGPGQSLRNPYTGILAIFSNLARLNAPITIFEDGLESRDFIHVEDVVEATWLCIKSQLSATEAFNVGSGKRITVNEVVSQIVQYFQSSSSITISGQYRQGDIRHNFADIRKLNRWMNFQPQWGFEKGLKNFLDWVSTQPVQANQYERSLTELQKRNFLKRPS